MDKLEVEFPEGMTKIVEQLSELLESVGTTRTIWKGSMNSAGARIIKGWEQLVKTTARKAIGDKLIVHVTEQ